MSKARNVVTERYASFNTNRMPLQKIHSSLAEGRNLQINDLRKSDVVTINHVGFTLDRNLSDDEALEKFAEKLYESACTDKKTGEKSDVPPGFPDRISALAFYRDTVARLARAGEVTEYVRSAFNGDDPFPTEPLYAVNFVPCKGGCVVHTRISFASYMDPSSNRCVSVDDKRPAMDLHIRAEATYRSDTGLFRGLSNRARGFGEGAFHANFRFDVDADVAFEKLRDACTKRAPTILETIIDFFARLFDAPNYEIYAPGFRETKYLKRTQPSCHNGNPEADGRIPEDAFRVSSQPDLLDQECRVHVSPNRDEGGDTQGKKTFVVYRPGGQWAGDLERIAPTLTEGWDSGGDQPNVDKRIKLLEQCTSHAQHDDVLKDLEDLRKIAREPNSDNDSQLNRIFEGWGFRTRAGADDLNVQLGNTPAPTPIAMFAHIRKLHDWRAAPVDLPERAAGNAPQKNVEALLSTLKVANQIMGTLGDSRDNRTPRQKDMINMVAWMQAVYLHNGGTREMLTAPLTNDERDSLESIRFLAGLA